MHLVVLAQTAGDAAAAMRWDGIYGAITGALIGGVVSAGVAVMVVRLTQRGDKRRALEQQSRAAAGQLTLELNRARQALRGMATHAPYEERQEVRRKVAVALSDSVLLNRPLLADDALAQLVSQAQSVFVTFMKRCQEPENEVIKRLTVPGGKPFTQPNIWQTGALPALSDYVTRVIDRMELHRRGERQPATPLPPPTWPEVDPALEAPRGSF